MVDVIIKVKDGKTIEDCAAEALALFGAGGNPESTQPECFLGLVNTPMQGGYTRIRCADAYAVALEYLQSGESCDLVTVLWPGVDEPVLDLPDGEMLGRFI